MRGIQTEFGLARNRLDRKLRFWITLLLGSLAVVVPAVIAAVEYRGQAQGLEADMYFRSRQVEQIIQERPELWEYETLRLREVTLAPSLHSIPTHHAIVGRNGRVLAENGIRTQSPRLNVQVPVFDSGREAARLTSNLSMRPMVLRVGLAALLSLSLFLVSARLLRHIPMRFIDALIEEIRAERQHSDIILDAIQEGVVAVDGHGQVLRMNPRAEALFGADERITGGVPFEKVIQHLCRPGSAMSEGLVVLPGPDGAPTSFEVEEFPISGVDHQDPGKVFLLYDITERKQAEVALARSEQDYRHLFEMANDPILIFEPETEIILEANQAASRTYGFDHDELVGLDLKTLTRDVQLGTSQIQNLMVSGQYHDFETVQLNRDGQEIHFLINSSVITYRGRKAILSLNRDIGDRKRLEAQLNHAQKMESLGTLAGGVAHDMNNVLGAILGLASAHIGNHPYGSPLHRALDTICKATERGGKMVKGLLSFARQSPAEENELNMNAVLQEQVGLLERTTLAKVRLVMDLEPELRPILGDASALAHAFMNLCVNAVDAMPEQGTLTLHSRNVDNDRIEIVVEDNGTGMPKEILAKAMDPFFTTKSEGKGTGLGLSLVFSTVQAHQGVMDIDSEPGKGTRVRLRFPACEMESRIAAQSVADAELSSHRALKVLLVDDDELIQSSAQAILEALGHTAVTSAQSGEEALAMLEAGAEPDLVILDMNMPGLGGAKTLPRLRSLRPEVPVLLSTGRTDQTALALASAYPGVTLLPKPFGLRELQKHLEFIGLG
jgi:PAS domain S-box-containing protein